MMPAVRRFPILAGHRDAAEGQRTVQRGHMQHSRLAGSGWGECLFWGAQKAPVPQEGLRYPHIGFEVPFPHHYQLSSSMTSNGILESKQISSDINPCLGELAVPAVTLFRPDVPSSMGCEHSSIVASSPVPATCDSCGGALWKTMENRVNLRHMFWVTTSSHV